MTPIETDRIFRAAIEQLKAEQISRREQWLTSQTQKAA